MRLVPGRDYFACDYCAALRFASGNVDGVQRLGERAELECPVCQGHELLTASVASTEVLQCPRCEGLLVRQRELAHVLRCRAAEASGPPAPARPLSAEDRERAIRCPCCRGPLDLHPYYGPGNVLIDSCGECAVIWLDRGEMDVIARALAREMTRRL